MTLEDLSARLLTKIGNYLSYRIRTKKEINDKLIQYLAKFDYSIAEKETIKAYGAWGKKKFMGKEYDGILRTTFLIDPRGVVKKVFENVTPADHAREILTFFDTQ